MKAKSSNKSLRIILILSIVLVLVAGISVGIYFLLKNRGMRFYEIELSKNLGQISLSTQSKTLAPNSEIIDRPVMVNITNESSNSYIRAKIVFENDSEDHRVLSFVNQLNYLVGTIETFDGENYSWKYKESDNAFYLVSSGESLKVVTNDHDNYCFIDTLKVPASIEQISSTNSEGNNVQVGQDIVIKIIFEAVQTVDIIGNKTGNIENVSPIFNNFASYSENGFVSQNGYIVSCSKNDENLVLPKFVGEDYIIGVKPNAFSSASLKNLIIPGSYIYFDNNSFSSCVNLEYVAIKSETPIKLFDNSFTANNKLSIYLPSTSLSYVRENFTTMPYINNIKSYTQVSTPNISEINKNAQAIYAPYVENFVGNFQDFTNLKLLIAPSLTNISEDMFKNNTSIIECDTPNVLNVGKSAFNGCTSLVSVSFSSKLETIGETSFAGCGRLQNINFVKNMNIIPKEAFKNCYSISSIKLLSEEVEIESGAFYNCSNLRIIDITGLKKLDTNALGLCAKLRYIKVNVVSGNDIHENSLDNSNNALFVFTNSSNKSNFTSNFSAFENRSILLQVNQGKLEKFEGNILSLNLSEFNLIDKIVEIKDEAFKDNKMLNNVTISSSVKIVGNNIFSGCDNLSNITINSYSIPLFKNETFKGFETLTVYVPYSCLDLYSKVFEDYDFTILSI